MSKRRVLIFVFLLFSVMCSMNNAFAAAQTFMKQFSSAFLVNLASDIYKTHNSSPDWANGSATNSSSSDYYYDNQMLCTLGISGTTNDVTFTFSLDSGSWLYLLDETDTRFSRPFGVDLIIRGQGSNGHETIAIDDSGTKIVHMGFNSGISGGNEATFTITAEKMKQYGSLWLDVCLVMDPVLGDNGKVEINGTTYTVTPTDDNYKARIKVVVKNADLSDGTETYFIDLLGYYTTSGEHPGSTSAILSVTPTAAASSLDIEKLKTDGVVQTVASYSFTTATFLNNTVLTNGKVHFYLSSTEGGTGTISDGFTLKFTRNNKVPSVLNGYNSVKYTARIVSSEYSGQTKDFDGNAVFGDTSNYYSVSADHISTSTGHGDLTRWHDSGTIEVRIDDDTDNLVAGLYTSTIYFHVVTDF